MAQEIQAHFFALAIICSLDCAGNWRRGHGIRDLIVEKKRQNSIEQTLNRIREEILRERLPFAVHVRP